MFFFCVSAIEIALPVTITLGGLCSAVVVDTWGARQGEQGRELLVCYFLFAR